MRPSGMVDGPRRRSEGRPAGQVEASALGVMDADRTPCADVNAAGDQVMGSGEGLARKGIRIQEGGS
jgi:hypothetical protein